MTIYIVTVKNLTTAEVRVVEISADCAQEAMKDALSHAFHQWDWRRSLAQWPPDVKEAVQA